MPLFRDGNRLLTGLRSIRLPMPHHGMGNTIPKSQWYGLGIDMVWEMPFGFPIGISQLKSIGIPKFSPIS